MEQFFRILKIIQGFTIKNQRSGEKWLTLTILILGINYQTVISQNQDPKNTFQYGVASGDPLDNQVILWTKISPINDEFPVEVVIRIGRDSMLESPVQTVRTEANPATDFTVKVDVGNLEPGTVYFYQFEALAAKSPIGRTQTAGLRIDQERLKFGVVSCNNYEHGYFSAFRRLSEKSGLNAIIHLGDYIYEYYSRSSRKKLKDRQHFPPKELLTLIDYRQRYGQYRKRSGFTGIASPLPFYQCLG